MDDSPFTPPVRGGFGDYSISFETVPTVLETREPLGALTWGWKCEDKENAPIVLTGGEKADCVDAPSATWGAALDKFFAAKFDVILDGFDAGKAELTSAHKSSLDGIASKWKTDKSLQIQLGGAADLKEADPAALSQKRADAVKAYLEAAGVAAGKISVESYGSDWARVATSTGKDEPKNRRVQVWVKK
jgi:outer membrane protein OmpA-like peptidoglycan-associated protein